METVSRIRDKLRGLTAGEVAAEAFLRTRQQVSRSISRAFDHPDTSYITDEDLEHAVADEALQDVAESIRARDKLRLTTGLADLAGTAEVIKQLFPDSVEETRSEAERILAHHLTIFARSFDLGPQIDWHTDPAAGARWPLEHFTRVPIRLKEGTDVRSVWELNRLQHFTTLGRAYALTADERYTEEFLIQFASWYEDNPPRFGVNWAVAMEAAIRAINLIASLEMFRGSPLLTDEAIQLILKSLISHGRFIRANLEFSYRAPSNHYLSNLIGLFAIGMTVPEIGESSEWVQFSAPRLLEELGRQVLADGVSYEGAIGYHRLVLEVYTIFFTLSHTNNIEVPGEHWQRLEAMFEFVRHYLKPDGTAPLIGDSDDGRLIKFKERSSLDHSYLMQIAAVLFESEVFKQSSRIDEEAIWWFGKEGYDVLEGLPVNEREVGSQGFAEAQVFVQRAGPLYSIIDCGDHGAHGRGSHAHSDALSIEVFAFGRTFLRDPGTFVYTASQRWRNLFRSTSYHNTVRVDGRDISLIREGELFALGPNIRPHVNAWESAAERDRLDAEHYSYTSLVEPVIHRRVVTFDKREGYWTIEDILTGAGRHRFEFFYNFDAGLEVTIEDDGRVIARNEASALAIVPASGHEMEIESATRWVATSYGTRVRSAGVIYRLQASVPFENVMLLIPYRLGEESKREQVIGDWLKGQNKAE